MNSGIDKSIAFWGTPPPPIGGMTVHIQRFSKRLEGEGWKVQYYDFKNSGRKESNITGVKSVYLWYLSLLFMKSPDIHYTVTTSSLVRFLAVLFGIIRNKKIIIRVGGHSMKNSIARGGMERRFNLFSLKYCSGFIGVNKEICEIASQYTKKEKVNQIPGFIPPVKSNSEPAIPKAITDFYGVSGTKIIITGQIVSRQGDDVYGLWDVIDFIEGVKKVEEKVKCCIVSYNYLNDNSAEREEYIDEIKKRGLSDNIFVYHNENELWPIINYADVFIRTSYTDGDSNAIREALYLEKKVIAANCVERPEGCILYDSGDVSDLISKYISSKSIEKYTVGPDHLSNYVKLKGLLNNL